MKLPVMMTVREALGFVWENRIWAINLALPAIVIIGILTALAGATGPAPVPGQPVQLQFIQVALLVFNIWFTIVYSVAWHRAYLAGERNATVLECYLWRMRTTKFVIQYLKLFIIFAVIGVLFVLIFLGVSGSPIGAGATFGAGAVVFLWLIGRLILILPATCVDHDLSLRDVLALSEGNGWQVVGAMIVTGIITAIVGAVPLMIAVGIVAATGTGETLSGYLAISLVGQFIGFIGIALGVSVLSVAYGKLSEAISSGQ